MVFRVSTKRLSEFRLAFFLTNNGTMAKYKECLNCQRAVYTESLKEYAQRNKIPLERTSAIFCLEDRNFHQKSEVCGLYTERLEKLVD